MAQSSGADWKTIPEFPMYDVSTLGLVRSRTRGAVKFLIPVVLQHGSAKGRVYYQLTRDGKLHRKQASKLVALAFVPNPFNKPLCDHIDRNLLNNTAENLRWVTHAENASNTDLRTNNTSGYKCVSFVKSHGKYKSTFTFNGERYSSKMCKTPEEAFAWYVAKNKEVAGEYSIFSSKD